MKSPIAFFILIPFSSVFASPVTYFQETQRMFYQSKAHPLASAIDDYRWMICSTTNERIPNGEATGTFPVFFSTYSADSPDQEEKRYFFLDSEALNIVNFDVGTFWKNSSTTLSGAGDRSRVVSSHVSRYRVGSKSLKTFDQEFRVSGNTLIIKEAFSSSPTDVQFIRCE